MPTVTRLSRSIEKSCQKAPLPSLLYSSLRLHSISQRHFTTSQVRRDTEAPARKDDDQAEKEQGAMSRRLSQMSEDSLSGSGAKKAVEEAGFDENLKKQLEERIAAADFRNDYASAFATVDLPSSAGRGTRDIAAAQPWSGQESIGDASLRMLNDAHKPLRGTPKIPVPRGPPLKIDTGRPSRKPSSGARLANARDRTSKYAELKDADLSEKEKAEYKAQMKARFQPSARAIPDTIAGLANLANQRIEDAIARGQFKNLPRGKKLERDYNASSPFLDTTEYFMNKIIKKQEIVPPWIEKQQEVVSTATRFRSQLRYAWKRHACRMIASAGGSVEAQIQRAREYAAAEARENPIKRKEEKLNPVDDDGHGSQITLTGELKATPDSSISTETHIEVKETSIDDSTAPTDITEITIDQSSPQPTSSTPPLAFRQPFRDPNWESIERSYHELTIANLNSLTRSYNLMAPRLAQKPYFNLQRELNACFAEVAPLLPEEIRERSIRPHVKVEVITHKEGSVLEKTFRLQKTRVFDENLEVKGYGFRQFWKDLWGKEGRRA
ncbi:hypothetical protein EG327_001165 [Venturia inaequalis]|uniref:DnaJ homologue subfamily C member 28 conserved domain-containing protein n=1 Tax=Venturia inaequalis TaxID=5025 RepID=A0A8H3VK30_VENIN|nr:hypothetical protein EG327_001165 [Venturia inaequalis]